MRIAVDGTFLHAGLATAQAGFLKQLFLSLADTYKEDEFIFFLIDKEDHPAGFSPNAMAVTLAPKPTNFLLYKWWYDVKAAGALKKHKADVFICTTGLCSLTTKVPQLLMVHNLAFVTASGPYANGSFSFYKKYIAAFLKKAVVIISFSHFIKKEMIDKYLISEEKIAVAQLAAGDSFKPLQWDERELIKNKYAGGCEYFIFPEGFDGAGNLMNVLKAFTIFKKWQKTNMKLVITANIEKSKKDAEKLNTYKHRKEIFFAEKLSIDEQALLTAGAYAMLFTPLYVINSLPVLDALQCEVPVIASGNSSLTEVAGEAALYADPAKPEEIAAQMKLIFKDEQLRTNMIKSGKALKKIDSLRETCDLIMRSVMEAVSA